jgi:hypothetical protein
VGAPNGAGVSFRRPFVPSLLPKEDGSSKVPARRPRFFVRDPVGYILASIRQGASNQITLRLEFGPSKAPNHCEDGIVFRNNLGFRPYLLGAKNIIDG